MQRALSLLLLASLVGCSASTPAERTVHAPVLDTYSDPAYSAPASALVFDPPVAAGLPAMDLSREYREPMAFYGFQQSTVTASYVRTDDRQSTAYLDSYDRRTISVRSSTSSR